MAGDNFKADMNTVETVVEWVDLGQIALAGIAAAGVRISIHMTVGHGDRVT